MCDRLYSILTSFYFCVKLFCDLLHVIFAEICVYIHCGGELLVAEDLLNRFGVYIVFKSDRRKRVAQLMSGACYSCCLLIFLK